MNFLSRIFKKAVEAVKPPDLNPCDFGFIDKYSQLAKDKGINHPAFEGRNTYEKDGFVLYKSVVRDTWVFDRIKKDAPGIIARFDSPLLEDDLNYILAYIERMAKHTHESQ